MKTIFKRPLFVNPQAYTTIPELYSIDKLQSFNFDENDTYTTKLVYNGRVESIIKKAGEEHILHLDLYTVDGSCVLGEWYVKGIDSESVVTIDKNILTIVANNNLKYPGLIAAWSAKGKSNEDVDRNILKDLTGNGHDITLNNFAWNTESGYSNPKYPDALVFDGVDDWGISKSLPILTDYTIIVKRVFLDNEKGYSGTIAAKGVNPERLGAFCFERNDNSYYSQTSFGEGSRLRIEKDVEISWQTTLSYLGKAIPRGNLLDEPTFTIGTAFLRITFLKGAIYSAYLFNRSLDEQEIKAFIRKHIDPEYLLPSEIPTPDVYYDFTNGDNSKGEANNVITDLSGNGNDAVAHNFAWNEESGYAEGGIKV